MSKRNKKSSGRFILVFLTIIMIIGIGTYFYLNSLPSSKIGMENVIVSEGWEKVGKDIMVSTGPANMTLIRSGGKGLLVDTGYSKEEAQRVKDYIDKNNIKLEAIVLTHLHNDHTANVAMFKNDNVKLYKPTDLKEGEELSVGEKKLRVLMTDGHTPRNGHVSIEITDDNVLVAGDVVITDGLPAVGGNYKDLIAALERIDSKGYSVIIPGHGAIVESKAAVSKNLEYLRNASKKVEELVNSGGTLPQIEGISIADCVSGISSTNEEVLKEVHRFNLTNIYQQVKMESAK